MKYYIADIETLEKIASLEIENLSTSIYAKIINQYPEILNGKYIILSEGSSNYSESKKNSYWGFPLDFDDEYDDEYNEDDNYILDEDDEYEDDEYGDDTTGWGY